MTTSNLFIDALLEAESASGLSSATTRQAFDAILQGQWTPSQIAGLLVALRAKPDSAVVITAAAQSLRAAMLPVAHNFDVLVDTCGTGGDGTKSLNLSTGAAIMLAAVGVPIAKHGNRAMSSRTGAADVLEKLGIPIGLGPAAAAAILNEIGVTFLMAPQHHPAMRHAAPVRRELGVRTVFNCLGPLANPAGAQYQLLGAYSNEIRPILAETLKRLGAKRAWVVHSDDGMDEVSPFGTTRVSQLEGDHITELEVAPGDFGLAPSEAGAVAGADPDYNAQSLLDVLSGKPHRARNAFIINAAAALHVARGVALREATKVMQTALDDGSALAKLNQWRTAAQRHAPDSVR
jgi:anthranilate phosphoribosyltransferase